MPDFVIWELDSVASAGAAFDNPSSVDTGMEGTTLTFDPNAEPIMMSVVDDDNLFLDGSSSQRLDGPLTVNGVEYEDNVRVDPEYAYTIMPEGSDDPADAIEIYAIRLDGGGPIVGFAASGDIDPSQTYVFTGAYDDEPSTSYDNLFVCFAAHTLIRTKRGDLPVHMLRQGDLLQTLDNGCQPIVWIGHSIVHVTDKTAPVVFEQGVLGNEARLSVSPQHRVLVRSETGGPSLVAAKAMLGMPGVSQANARLAHYYHVLLERHELLLSEGASTESFNPGFQGWQMLGKRNQRSLSRFVTAPLRGQHVYSMARPVIRPGRWTMGPQTQLRVTA
ncbi:Hint domain-containing protein [Paracoccus aestuariivivens]|uniref:Hedgehog/Intein (Hint) domain-containing protein n=1 Tax=Paracoccus aestuariivivens TaxID=1820333 RepID=A0A6L6J2I1_9RHOB|nr:Hint domain-containing protein [Paracoccus aestuariivivens]MTH76282.1 hypothetical protein [Paracoccus aestuariivivens]